MADLLKQKWDSFCDELKTAGDIISEQVNLSETDKTEGYRYLLRLLRLSLEMNFEHSNSMHPSFYNLSHETAKIGADNPDNIYLNANINGSESYEIAGNIGEVEYLSFGLKENRYSIDGKMRSLGELEMSEMDIDEIGNFKLVLGPNSNSRNYLNLPKDTNMIIVRQTYTDRFNQKHASMNIKKLGNIDIPPLLNIQELEFHLDNSIAFVKGTANTFLNWVKDFEKNHKNSLPLGDQAFFQAAGGDPKIFYLHGYYEFNSDEYMEINTPIPDCDYWNFQLENYWMESLDYRHYPIHLNSKSATIDNHDLKIIVTHHPINIKNNLITEGRKNGAMLLRWIGADSCPIPDVKIKKLDTLESI